MSTNQPINEIPKIQQQPRAASETAIHYGYVAYHDIDLTGSYGIERKVQPPNSPSFTGLPSRQLLPFTNIVISEIDNYAAASTSYVRTSVPVVSKQKTARQCVEEMRDSYEQWGFVVLDMLTGFPEEDAFKIFQAIQPFAYKLKDLQNAVEYGADERINASVPYTAVYGDQTVDLEPLPAELKEIAGKVKETILKSIDVAVAMGEDLREKTTQSMTQYFATGTGKRRPDPHDVYIFAEFDQEIPKLISSGKPSDDGLGVLSKLAEVLGMQKKSDEIEQELAELRALKEELKAATAAPKVATIGETVIVEGKTATIVGKPFGKVKVEFEDGSTATVTKDELE